MATERISDPHPIPTRWSTQYRDGLVVLTLLRPEDPTFDQVEFRMPASVAKSLGCDLIAAAADAD